MKYVAEFRNVEVTDEQRPSEQQAPNADEIVQKKPRFNSKAVGAGIGTAIALGMTATQMYAKYRATTNTITGNQIAQRSLDNKMAYLNEGVNIIGGATVGFMVGGVPGAVAFAMAQAVKLGMQSYNVAMENQIKQAQWQVESRVNGERQTRLVKDITGIRV